MGQMSACATFKREQVVNLLSRLPHQDASGQLRTASELAWIGIQRRGRDTAVRGRLNAAARGRVGATHFVPALKSFASLSLPARREMALALGDLAGSVAVADLARLAKGGDAGTRLIAVDALGKIGGPQAVAALETASGDTNETVRAEAIRSLGHLAVAEAKRDAGGPEGSPVETLFLETIAGDPSEYVRGVAEEALMAVRHARSRRARAAAARAAAPAAIVSVSTH